VEARTTEQELREAFARIEVAVDGGDRDLQALGFWRLVAGVKRDPAAADRWAEQIGRIDGKAFRAGVRLRAPVWVGNLLLLIGVGSVRLRRRRSRGHERGLVAGLALILRRTVVVSTHCLAHWLSGVSPDPLLELLRRRPFRPAGLKTDYSSYLRADPRPRRHARLGCDRYQALALRGAPVLAGDPGAVVGGGGPAGARRVADRHRRGIQRAIGATGRGSGANGRSRGQGGGKP